MQSDYAKLCPYVLARKFAMANCDTTLNAHSKPFGTSSLRRPECVHTYGPAKYIYCCLSSVLYSSGGVKNRTSDHGDARHKFNDPVSPHSPRLAASTAAMWVRTAASHPGAARPFVYFRDTFYQAKCRASRALGLSLRNQSDYTEGDGGAVHLCSGIN